MYEGMRANDISDVVAADRVHVWHHLTQHKAFETTDPRIIVQGKGMRVWDASGRETLDAVIQQIQEQSQLSSELSDILGDLAGAGQIINSKVFSAEMITILCAGTGIAIVIPIASWITAYVLVKTNKEGH
jgi:hypothetical protein